MRLAAVHALDEWIAKHEEAGTLNGILGELGSTCSVGHENHQAFRIHRLSMTHGLEPILRLSRSRFVHWRDQFPSRCALRTILTLRL